VLRLKGTLEPVVVELSRGLSLLCGLAGDSIALW
jgi:hypothetical protein